MGIRHLSIHQFRLFSDIEFSPSPDLNIIHGPNASGKTSVLEAICILSRGRSFRTNNIKHAVKAGSEKFQLIAKIDSLDRQVYVGMERGMSHFEVRFDGQQVKKISDLSAQIPVQVIQPDSHKIIEEGPELRRRYLDWGVFHLHHSFSVSHSNYLKNLRQRNAALKSKHPVELVKAWDVELIKAANEIDQQRKHYLEQLNQVLPPLLANQLGKFDFSMNYYPGWNRDYSFEEALFNNLPKDLEAGFTSVGPHRADLKLSVDGIPAAEKISRGQQKILVTTMLLAQAILYNQQQACSQQSQCILLIDDVAAELDETHRKKLIQVLDENQFQLFVTSITPGKLWDRYTKNQLRIDLNRKCGTHAGGAHRAPSGA